MTQSLMSDQLGQQEYLTPKETADLIPGMTVGALSQLRCTGRGPRYRAPTKRTIIYVKSEVIAWIEASARYGTAPDAVA